MRKRIFREDNNNKNSKRIYPHIIDQVSHPPTPNKLQYICYRPGITSPNILQYTPVLTDQALLVYASPALCYRPKASLFAGETRVQPLTTRTG